MKLRTGFVTNSSSSSYILAMKKVCKCPTCGITPPTIIDYIEANGSACGRSDDNEVHACTREGLIREYKNKIKEQKQTLKDNVWRRGDEILWTSSSGDFHWTVAQQRIECDKNIKEYETTLEKIRAVPDNQEVVSISISIHDDYAKQLIESTCTIIEGCED